MSISESLVVDGLRMLANLEASQGMILAERFRNALAEDMGRQEAQKLVKEPCHQIALVERRSLSSVLRESSAMPLDWDGLSDPNWYLGSLDWFVDRILQQARSEHACERRCGVCLEKGVGGAELGAEFARQVAIAAMNRWPLAFSLDYARDGPFR